jgi:hypothetical protein
MSSCAVPPVNTWSSFTMIRRTTPMRMGKLADIDGSRIIWAHDMGRQKNQELIRYFKNRQVWLVEPDFAPPKLSAYTGDY